MHSAINRLQTTFSSFTTYATILASIIAVVSLLTEPTPSIPSGALKLYNVQTVKGRPHYYTSKKEEYAHIKFDLDLDISSLFSWNTKQVFLYVVASYPPTSTASDKGEGYSESIVWDAILKSPLQPEHHNQYIYPQDREVRKGSNKLKGRKQSSISYATPGVLKLDHQRPKYQITDANGKLAGVKNATLSLHYNIQPWVGALVWGNAPPRSGGPGFNLGGPAKSVSRKTEEKLAAKSVAVGDWWMSLLPGFVKGLTWKTLGGSARTAPFSFPELKDRKEAAKEAGGSLNVERGGERSKEQGFF